MQVNHMFSRISLVYSHRGLILVEYDKNNFQ